MFNSQKINNDPKPYRYVTRGGEVKRTRRGDDVLPAYSEHDPRPEYDNNPNPLLMEIRELLHIPDRLETYRVNLEAINSPEYEVLQAEEHINHARKVLEKLVNVYTEQ